MTYRIMSAKARTASRVFAALTATIMLAAIGAAHAVAQQAPAPRAREAKARARQAGSQPSPRSSRPRPRSSRPSRLRSRPRRRRAISRN